MKRKIFRNRYIFLLDILSIIFSSLIAYFTVFTDIKLSDTPMLYIIGLYIVSVAIVFFAFRVYAVAWNISGTRELMKFLRVNLVAMAVMFLLSEVMHLLGYLPYQRRIIFATCVVSILCMTVIRLVYKEAYKNISAKEIANNPESNNDKVRVLIVGAGDAGTIIVRNVLGTDGDRFEIVGFVDDDRSKIGKIWYGYKVLGGRTDIIRICEQYNVDRIILAIPSAYVEEKKNIIEICHKTKCKLLTIPSVTDLLEQPESENIIRKVKIEDLLERDPILLDNKGISNLVKDKIIMVTGGGGSIGSELCRQVMRFSPKKLVIVDIYENNAYDIQMELNDKYPNNKPVVLIGSIRDRNRLEEIFDTYRPQIVFHAAAHKHVPLMEDSPREAVKNNVFGTYNLAQTADKFGVEKFVMISTDKAVNPTNVMGATKRLCEMIIQSMEGRSQTEFVAVRFGNVLGSNGSVIPLFKKQIEDGGPVKVTHRDVTRFFMTIPEAAQLVIQAACYAHGGEIFVLDMGKPVRIYDLAENIIRLSGHTPGDDIKIKIIGLRPGEKLYEELLMDKKGLKNTGHKKIFVDRPKFLSAEELESKLGMLREAVESESDEQIRDVIERVVPTYIRDNETFNSNCKNEIKDIAKSSYC